MWEPDAQSDAHYWLSVLGGHLSIGAALWLAFAWLGPWWAVAAAAAGYACWEVWSARRWGLLLFDSLLDTVGVTFGALTAAGLWLHSWPLAALCCVCAFVIGFAGYSTRRD